MSNIATNGIKLFKSNVQGNRVVISFDNLTIESKIAPGPLMGENITGGEVIEVQPGTNNIGIVARVGSGPNADKGYFCSYFNNVFSDWIFLGPTAQLQSIAWIGNKFICARVDPTASFLIQQNIDGTVISSTAIPGGTSEGILYYDYIDGRFVISETGQFTQVGPYKLIKAIRRRLNNADIYTGQKTNPDTLFTTNGSNIAFESGPQPNYPQFVVIGSSLVVNGGANYNPPYPTVPVEPPIPPEPNPVPPIPNHKDVVERMRVKYNGLGEGNERAYTITNAVAWELRAEGAGTFYKTSGTQYNQRSIDTLIYKHQIDDPAGKGKTFDILGDAERRATPQWARTDPSGFGDERVWRAPIEPPNPEPIPPSPENPDRDMLIHIRDEINEFLGE